MKNRHRSLLGIQMLLLLLMPFLLSSSYSLHTSSGMNRVRKLLSTSRARSSPPSRQKHHETMIGRATKPIKQTGVSFRRIPPSTSNPTQNRARPRINGPVNR